MFAGIGFEKFFPKAEETSGVNKPTKGEESGSQGTVQHIYIFCSQIWWIFCCHSDENAKAQESFLREGQDRSNNDGDERQRGRKKEESHWWTRFQVWIHSVQLVNASN